VRVYNFGRGAYFSTQERILFQQLLLRNAVPDMAIFLDGLNDFHLTTHSAGYSRLERAFAATDPFKGGAGLRDAVVALGAHLPLIRAAAIIERKMSEQPAELPTYKPAELPRRDLDALIDRYLHNKRQITGVAREYGLKPLFVWQPVPGYKYDLRHHAALNPVHGLGGHERSGQGYPVAAERRAEFGGSFLWLADIQEHRAEALYVDTVHYTAAFSDVIAGEIAAHILRGAAD
jgi:hypothetical protein